MDKNEVINNLIFLGERLSNVIVLKIEKDLQKYAIEDIDEIINELNLLKNKI